MNADDYGYIRYDDSNTLNTTFRIAHSTMFGDTPESLGKEFEDDIRKITVKYNQDAIWIRGNGAAVLMESMTKEHMINALRKTRRSFINPTRESLLYQQLLLHAIESGIINRNAGEWDAEENKK